MNSMSGEKLKGIPYTGTLPAVLTGTKAGYLHRYKVYGNTEQTGTPTPENPIVPQECGERTENLFDISDYSVGTTTFITKRITLEPNTTYTMSSNCPLYNVGALIAIGNVGESFTTANNGVYPNHPITRTTDVNGELVIGLRTNGSDYSPADYKTMLNLGSTALPYEPYGYKLPLLSGSTPVDIYLGDEPLRKIGDYADYIDYGTGKIVRQVGKKVMTGNEVISKNSSSTTNYLFYMPRSSLTGSISKTSIVCDRLQAVVEPPVAQIGINTNNNYNMVYFNFGADVMNAQPSGNTIDGCKEYFAAQYTAGTPMTIWYVLATPAEEDPPVPFPQIPTAANSTTISWAGQGLAPSQFDSVQEWVDIPTYTYTNGEWVADN